MSLTEGLRANKKEGPIDRIKGSIQNAWTIMKPQTLNLRPPNFVDLFPTALGWDVLNETIVPVMWPSLDDLLNKGHTLLCERANPPAVHDHEPPLAPPGGQELIRG